MLFTRPPPMPEPTCDALLRGTAQRWWIDAGPLAGSVVDYDFHDDGSVVWRAVAGARQGQAGRARTFHAQPVPGRLQLVSFCTPIGTTVGAILDHAAGRVTGFETADGVCTPFAGRLRIL